MAYKLVKQSSNGTSAFFQEEGQEKGKWYVYDKRVQPFAVKLREGQLVKFRTENKEGKDHIMFIQLEGQENGGASRSFSKPAWQVGNKPAWKPTRSSYEKDPATQESIIKQTVMKASSEIIASRTYPTLEASLEAFDKVFEHLYAKVKAEMNPSHETNLGAVEVYDETNPNTEPA